MELNDLRETTAPRAPAYAVYGYKYTRRKFSLYSLIRVYSLFYIIHTILGLSMVFKE